MENNTDAILDRIRVLEKKIEEGALSLNEEQLAALASQRETGDGGENPILRPAPSIDREEILKQELQPAECEDMDQIMSSIRQIKQEPELRGKVGSGTMSLLDQASINIGHDRKSIVLSFEGTEKGNMAYRQFSKDMHREALKEVIGDLTGKSVEITCQMKDSLVETDISNINLSKVNFAVITQE